jgi:tetratricopeptide (TPR) repeat protein
VVSDLDEATLSDVLNTLNRFESVAAGYLPGVPATVEIPMQMLIFSSNRVFSGYFGSSKFAGFLQPSLTSSTVVISPNRGNHALMATALHEYSHYLLRNRLDVTLPLWFDEGLASLLATAEFDTAQAVVGRLPLKALRALESERRGTRLSLKEVLTTDYLMDWPRRRIDEFYYWSLLLTHYLMLDDPERRATLEQYLSERERPLVKYLGTSYRGLERRLGRYLQGRVPTVSVPLPPQSPLVLSRRCLDPLARDLAISRAIVDRNPERVLELAAQHLPEHADDARLLVLQSRARAELGNHDEAMRLARQAQTVAPDDARALSNLADQTASRCLLRSDAECRERWKEASELYRQALQRDHKLFDAVFGLGLAYLHSGHAGEAVNYLKLAYSRAPWAVHVNFFLGESYRIIGDTRATVYLENARSWAQSPLWRSLAETALAESRR